MTVAQTPMVLVKGGAASQWSPECEKALIQCGYDPEAFGTYKHVKSKIDEAGAKVAQYDEASPAARAGMTPPTPDERFLAQCQSGHISQDALFRAQKGRDSPCDNHPGSEGNVTGLAPCMPHFGQSNRVGSTHQRITVDEPRSAAACGAPGTVMTPGQVQGCAQNTINTALEGAHGPAATAPPAQLLGQAEQLRQDREGQPNAQANQTKEQERQTRQAGSAAAQQASAQSLQAKKGVAAPANAQEREDAQKKAAECIEAFRKAGQDAMRQQVIGENSTANKTSTRDAATARAQTAEANQKSAQDRSAAAQQRAEAAEKESADAQAALDAHGPRKRDDTARDLRQQRDEAAARATAARQEARQANTEANAHGREAERARADEAEANRRLRPPPPPQGMTDDEHCLQQQADHLEPHLPNLPPMTGQVPGPTPEGNGPQDDGESSGTV